MDIIFPGGLNQRHMQPKVIKHVFNDRALFDIYRNYIEMLRGNPPDNSEDGGPFYRRAFDTNNQKSFGKQCLGVNKLSQLMKCMCEEAGIKGNFTNHSGKRTCATQLYQCGIEEQEIMNRTGHRSVNSVRKYKRASDSMLQNISNVLEPPRKCIKSECETESVSKKSFQHVNSSPATYTNCTFNISYTDYA